MPLLESISAAMTWERFLVLWGLVTPAIAWTVTRRWERKNQQSQWNNERERWLQERRADDERALESAQRQAIDQQRAKMQDVFSRFLKGASAIQVAAELIFADQKRAAVDATMEDFILSFQQLLLVSSSDTIAAAVSIWNQCIELAQIGTSREQAAESRVELRAIRAKFVEEAREDIADPFGRLKSPGISIRPAITIGGFHLSDAG